MNPVDLVGVINDALPGLVAEAARSMTQDRVVGSNIGYGFLRLSSDAVSMQIDRRVAWQGFSPTMTSIMGNGSIAHAACESFGTGRTSIEVTPAELLCVVLPWTDETMQRMAAIRLSRSDSAVVLVLWRRCLAAERALLYLGNHFAEPVTLCELASVACISKFHLVRRFTRTWGITPHRYQLLLRLSRAKAMLREGTCITDTAHGLGFADHSHMGRSFRLLTGMTPSQYQRSV
jgi:AraC-like DNA-binding protein